MLGKLRALFCPQRKNNKKQPPNIYKICDIGAGTRIFHSNLDGLFPHLLHIGKNCIVAPEAMFLTHDASYYLHTGEYRVAPVHIGDNCFIGYGVIVMPGVTIGNNVIIGAGSIVTRDIPDDTVAVGSPAKVTCSIDEYLEKRKKDQMVPAPFQGKTPVDVTPEDIEAFQKRVK